MTAYLHGGLYVVETAPPRNSILRALKQIDDRLFLEKQVSTDGRHVWCVVVDLGDRPPVTILEYRDDDGVPIPEPTDSLVWRIAQMDRDGGRLHKRVLQANEDLKAARARKAREETAELARDIVPRISDTRSVLLPRGVDLRRARDRKRAQGYRI